MSDFDVVVIGAGMVGAAAALGFARKSASVAIIESVLPKPYSSEDQPDLRVSAISLATEELLTELEAWSNVKAMRSCPYSKLAVWEDASAKTEFNSFDGGFAHMGNIIENRILQLALHGELRKLENVRWFEKFTSVNSETNEVVLSDDETISANLIVAADGAQSKVRGQLGIGQTAWQYEQKVLAISIQTNEPQQDITWQQFTPTGPRAYLPMYDGMASLVWYDSTTTINKLMELDNGALKRAIQEHFPEELVDFTVLDRAFFPITRMHAKDYLKNRVVLIGDAAHTINPLAGQGVNLGYQDVKVLLEEVSGFSEENLASALQQYQKRRMPQNLLMMSAMDALYSVFSNDLGPLKLARNLGLKIADKSGWLKIEAMKYAMGLK